MAKDFTYFHGFYCRLDSKSDDKQTNLHGDRVSVGQEIQFVFEDYVNTRRKEASRVVVTNLANEALGFVPAFEARRITKLNNEAWICRVAVSAVGYNEARREYFFEVGIICYELKYAKALDSFAASLFERMAKGERPALAISEKTIKRAIQGEDVQASIKNTRLPKLKTGEAYYKKRRSSTEKLIIAGSNRKIGCFIASGALALCAAIACIVIFLKVWGVW